MMFNKSKEALVDLQKNLHCCKCDQRSEELLCLGECKHWFCRSCAESGEGQPCPTCGVRSVAKKTHVDVQLSNVALQCSQMMELINGHCTTLPAKNSLESMNGCLFENFSNESPIKKRKKDTSDSIRKEEDRIRQDKTHARLRSSEKLVGEKDTTVGKRDPKNKSLTLKHSELLPESSEGDHFVKLKSAYKRYNATSLSAVPNIFDRMAEFHTPEPRKTKSQSFTETPRSNTGKAKKTIEKTVAGDNDKFITPDKQEMTLQATKTLQSFSNASNSIAGKVTPQSTKKAQQSKLDKRNAKGETSLQVATIKRNIDEVKRLLEAGANPNVKDNAGWTPLHEAMSHGDSDIAALLIANGASVNAPGMHNLTPLHEAVSFQYANCVQLLIDNGADMFCRNVDGYSPIDLAQGEIKDMFLQATQSRFVSEVDVPLQDESSKPLCFTGSNLSKEQSKLLAQYAKALQAKVVKEVTSDVTHLITNVSEDGSCTRTFKYLSAIVTGKWIVDFQWLENYFNQNIRVPEGVFQASGCTNHPNSDAPKKALENRLKQLPLLLDGCQMFLHSKFESSGFSKEELANLVKQGGGVVLKREPHLHKLDDYPYTHPYHAQNSLSLADCTIYVIYDDACPNPPSVQATRMACLPASWLIDSISTFSLLDKKVYVK